MAAQYKTQCPHCGAQFKISDDHLQQARGAVRCGSCLQIFQASDHLLGEPNDVPPAAGANDRWANALDDSRPPAGKSAPSSNETAPDPATQNEDFDSGLGEMELSDSFLNMGEEEESGLGEDFSDMSGAGRANHSDNADESWAEELLKELGDEGEPPAQPSPKARAGSEAPASTRDRSEGVSSRPQPLHTKAKSVEPEEASDQTLFDDLDLFDNDLVTHSASRPQTERLEYLQRGQPAHRFADIAKWTGLAALALIVLVAQYVFFHFDTLARTPEWRPAFVQLCEVAGCELPGRSNLQALRGANLVVRSHPDYRNALVVDAILFNQADYRQPFPVLELTFSSLDGTPLASRRFQPAEYLHGDLQGLDTMPIEVPLHISLEIVDPGENAVNYNLRLLPAPDAPA